MFLDLNTPEEANHTAIQEGLRRENRGVPRDYCAAIVTNLVHRYGAPKKATPGSWKVFYSPPKIRAPERPPGDDVFDSIRESLRDYGQDIPQEI